MSAFWLGAFAGMALAIGIALAGYWLGSTHGDATLRDQRDALLKQRDALLVERAALGSMNAEKSVYISELHERLARYETPNKRLTVPSRGRTT